MEYVFTQKRIVSLSITVANVFLKLFSFDAIMLLAVNSGFSQVSSAANATGGRPSLDKVIVARFREIWKAVNRYSLRWLRTTISTNLQLCNMTTYATPILSNKLFS